jgi:nitroreductase
LNQLRWRGNKAIRSGQEGLGADWKTLEETLVLTPSSFGLQPWRFIVITDQ